MGKVLTAKVKFDTKSAEASLKRLTNKINNVQKAIDKSTKSTGKFDKALNKAITATKKLDTATKKVATNTNRVANTTKKVVSANDKAAASARKLSSAYRSSNNHASSLLTTVKRIAGAYLGMQTLQTGIKTSDTITSAENRLNDLNGGDKAATQSSLDKMYTSAQKARMSYSDMVSNASKSMTLAGDAFQGNIDNAIRFQEIMAKTYALGGASSAEMSTSMYQMIQALGAGTLAGDELRSVREGAPLAYEAIEQFVQGIYETDESLKDLAADGLVTSEMVVSAIMKSGDKIDERFDKTAMTFAQAWDLIKNTATKAFEPVLQRLNKALSSNAGQKIIKGISYALIGLANVVNWTFDVFASFFGWCADNWNWLKWIVIGVIGAITAYLVYWTTCTLMNAAIQIASWIAVHWQMLLILVMIGALVAGIVWLANTTATGAEFICKALLMIAGAVILVGTIIALVTGSVTMLVFGLILGAIAAIVALMAYCGEEVMGGIYTVGAFIYNLVVGLLNSILQYIWFAVDPILGIVEFILNACKGGFDSFGDACANLIGQIISWFLSLGKVVTKIIDAIFGTDWTSGLNSLQDSVIAWGKNEKAITISREAPTVQSIMGNFGLELPDRIAYGDAYANGAKVGANIENAINSFGSKIKNGISGFNLDKLGASLDRLPDPNDPKYNISGAWDKPSVDDLLGGVDSIKDSLDIADDDLEYLRKVADMEWRNEFTTAEIKIDMTNHNTVNSDRDLDGIVGYLSEVLRDEMTSVAEGVHY